jgi:hypothetical protein
MSFPSEGRGHKFESCRARQRINGLARDVGIKAAPSYPVATKFSKRASSESLHARPPKVGGATVFQAEDEGSIPFTRSNDFSYLGRQNASQRIVGSIWEPPGRPLARFSPPRVTNRIGKGREVCAGTSISRATARPSLAAPASSA